MCRRLRQRPTIRLSGWVVQTCRRPVWVILMVWPCSSLLLVTTQSLFVDLSNCSPVILLVDYAVFFLSIHFFYLFFFNFSCFYLVLLINPCSPVLSCSQNCISTVSSHCCLYPTPTFPFIYTACMVVKGFLVGHMVPHSLFPLPPTSLSLWERYRDRDGDREKEHPAKVTCTPTTLRQILSMHVFLVLPVWSRSLYELQDFFIFERKDWWVGCCKVPTNGVACELQK